ncbi:hypothetical protein VPNG_04077 [Cytospora leucostoma]|uniref:EthD domain-containing protein n=1 Tax=Cytospora leucostoma TaxID=1230097 RepID=A0A423XD09_9PEZI|nr:hypothetical protein VPNG_04077 [Cytospora leucostoma]
MAEKQEALAELPQSSGQLIKYTVGHHRNKAVSHEEFIKWFTHEHLPLALPVFKKHNISKYTLFVTPPTINETFGAELAKIRPGWGIGGFDAVLEYWLHDLNDLKGLLTDPEWAGAVKDEDKWCDLSTSTVHIGFDTPYLLETGEVVNLPK